MLGKALFENITIQPQFAHFFLAFMHGRYNFMNLVNDLRTLDEGLYKNLMFLKTYTVSWGHEGCVGVMCCFVGLWGYFRSQVHGLYIPYH